DFFDPAFENTVSGTSVSAKSKYKRESHARNEPFQLQITGKRRKRAAFRPLNRVRAAYRGLVFDVALTRGCDPTASCARGNRNTDEEQGVVAGRRDAGNLTGEVSVALRAESDRGCVEDGGRRRAGVANESAGDGRNRAGRAGCIAAVEDQA